MTSKTIKFYSHYDWDSSDTMTYLLSKAGYKPVSHPMDADIIVFNGGADIGTEIYSEIPCMRGIPQFMSTRDKEEVALFDMAEREGKFMLGICRGAQLLNCLNGGTLWQHVDNHGRDHKMIDLATRRLYMATSTHHQMMRPAKDAKIIAVANEAANKHAEEVHKHFQPSKVTDPINGADTEIVWYGKTRSLCIQGHPEYVPGSDFANYCLNLITQHMNEKVAA